jgi:hypothetical protein
MRFLFTAALALGVSVLGISKASAQQFSLNRTGLFKDGAMNPAQSCLRADVDAKAGIGVLHLGTWSQFAGSAGNWGARWSYGENIGRDALDKILGSALSKSRSALNSNTEFYTFLLRFRLNPETGAEVWVDNSTRFETKMNVPNNLLRLFVYGNKEYVGQDLSGVFNTEFYLQSYNKTAFGYRRNFGEKLSLGGSLNLYQGIVNARGEITESDMNYPAGGDSIVLTYKGSFDASIGINNSDDLDNATFDNIGNFANLGTGMSLGAQYKINDRYSLQGTLRDWGFIRWNTTGYNTKVDGRTVYRGYDVLDSAFFDGTVEAIVDRLGSYERDTTKRKYTEALSPNWEIGAQAQWNKRLANRLLVTRQGFTRNIQFTLLTDLNVIGKLHAVLNLGTGTIRNTMLGGTIYYDSRRFQFFVASEQIGNVTLKGTNLGADANMGLVFKW